MLQNPDLFTTRMRRATRRVHSISDSLVNAKFAISLSDEKVWAGGLFVFYHVFSYLEDAKERLKMADFDSLFVHPVVYRKEAFETDLTHYLGEKWRTELKPEALHNYLLHLERLEKTRPRLLMAYAYHLYLGLLSGGQILASKRRIFGDMNRLTYYKDKVTDFSGGDIPQLKRDFREAMNGIAATMSADEQDEFICESNNVFFLNNSIVASVGGQAEVLKSLLWKLSLIGVIITGIVIGYKLCK